MARKPRIFYFGANYHVMLRGNNRNKIFFSSEDKLKFYSLLRENTQRYSCKIHAFCLMTNHVHLLIETAHTPLSKIMHNINFRYTQWINYRKNKVGHLLQGRYRANIIEDDQYFLEAVRYIHRNPVEAGMVSHASHYRWSSQRTYDGTNKIKWLTTEKTFGFFSPKLPAARVAFNEFISMARSSEPGQFDDLLLFEHSPKSEKVHQNTPSISLSTLINIICEQLQQAEHNLHRQSLSRTHAVARAKIAWLARELKICTVTDVAKYFNRDATTFSKALKRLDENCEALEELTVLKSALKESTNQA